APTMMIFCISMCEIQLIAPFDALHGRVEVAEFYPRELLMDQLHQLFHAHAFAGFGYAQLAEVPVRIDIEIPPLDHGQVGGADEFAKGFVFVDTICHPREDEIIDAGPAAETANDAQAFDDVIEDIVVGTVVGVIDRGPGGVEAHPDRIEPRFAEGADGCGLRTVGIDVDAAAGRVFAHGNDGLADGLPHQQRFAFATLAKAYDREGCFLQVWNRELYDLFGRWFELEPVLCRRDRLFLRLERDAADAVGIAGRLGRYRAFPAAHKEIAGGGAVIGETAVLRQVFDEAVLRIGLGDGVDPGVDNIPIVPAAILADVLFDADGGDIELAVMPAS